MNVIVLYTIALTRAGESKITIVGFPKTWLSKADHVLQDVINHIYRQDRGSGTLEVGCNTNKGALGSYGIRSKFRHHKYIRAQSS